MHSHISRLIGRTLDRLIELSIDCVGVAGVQVRIHTTLEVLSVPSSQTSLRMLPDPKFDDYQVSAF